MHLKQFRKRRIFDVVTVDCTDETELTILNLRLAELSTTVNFFVLVDTSHNFSNDDVDGLQS